MLRRKIGILTTLLSLIIGTGFILPGKTTSQIVEANPIAQATKKLSTQKLPLSIFRQIQRDIRKRFGVSASNLQLSAATGETWDGCMGLPQPNGACTAIAIPGWRVVVSHRVKNRFWVYHANNDGRRLAYNATASLPRNAQISPPGMIARSKIIPKSSSSVIFQAAQITGHSLEYYAWELTGDGVLTRRAIARNPGKPEVVRKLSRQELEQFTEVLNRNSFNHFHSLSYLNMEAIAADASSLQLNYNGFVVEYTQTDLQKYPVKLRRIIAAWERIQQ